TGEKPKGPAIILSNHTSNYDWLFVADAAYPRRTTFVATYHFFTFKKLGYWLRRMGAIPKCQFATDLLSMKRIRYTLDKNKGMVFIAPEGTVYANGKLGFISPSIAKTIRIFKAPVYATKIQGAGLGIAKWSKNAHRSRISVDTHLLLSQEDIKSLSVDEIMEKINSALSYDEFQYQKEWNIRIKGNDKLEGFDNMFYKCPCCGKEFYLKSSGNTVECSSCGTKATIGEDFRFTWSTKKQYFEHYGEWYDWQLEEAKKEIKKEGFKLEEEMDYGIDKPGINNYVKVGKGTLTFTREGWTYKGTYNGETVEEHDAPEEVFLATLKAGKHIELPFKNGHCRVFYPTANPKTSMKWHLYSRAMSEILEEERAEAKSKA
ncbi:MAG: 1-acyl-sn-glycerol-3-phosphate acyltransferase, partial [Spirochaetales bacterium]|nr:1-acyl-sn-glycerol-3-phosphate acyltransferase [Candidatus Physcosoma equi]